MRNVRASSVSSCLNVRSSICFALFGVKRYDSYTDPGGFFIIICAIPLALAFLGDYVGMKSSLAARYHDWASLAVIIYKMLRFSSIHFSKT